MRKATAFIIAAAAWTGFIGQYFLSNAGKSGAALATATINYFSYFTTLSNLFIAVGLTAVFLASPASAFLTGQVLFVDGGFSCGLAWPIDFDNQ